MSAVMAPTTLPATRMMPRDTASENTALLTTKAEIPAHQGSSACSASATSTASVTDAAASAASNPRVPRQSSECSSVRSAPGISRSIDWASIKDHGPGIGPHMQHNLRVGILQHQRYRKAPLETDPVSRRLDIGQHLGHALLAADAASNTLDSGAVNVPRVGVEPDPGSAADLHVADHALLVVGEDPPSMRVDETNQRRVLDRLVADAQHEIGDRAVGRSEQLCLIELPLQIGDFGADRRDGGLVQGQRLLRFRYCGLGIGRSRLRLLLLRS